MQALEAPIMVSANLNKVVEVTGPGWIGKIKSNLPKEKFTLLELKDNWGIKPFEWDGL